MLRSNQLRHYLAVMQSLGFSAEAVLDGTGLEAARLQDPNCLVELPQCKLVVSNLIRLTGDQGIGLRMAQDMNMADFGIIAHAMLSARTLREAVTYWIRYRNLAGMLINFSQVDEPEGWTVEFTESEPLGFVYNFCVEEILVTGIKIASLLTQRTVKVHRIQLSFPAPLHAELYRRYFDCPVHFNSSRSSITVSQPHFDCPLPSRDEELNEILSRRCNRMSRQIGDQKIYTTRVRALLMARSSTIPSHEEAARLLGVSTRSLRRYLLEEGTHYQGLVDQFRFDLAAEYFEAGDLSTKEVGYLLGFRDTNAFRRAFKTWSGTTVESFKRSRRIGAEGAAASTRSAPHARLRQA